MIAKPLLEGNPTCNESSLKTSGVKARAEYNSGTSIHHTENYNIEIFTNFEIRT
jgi:hypothetical protein